MPTKFILKGIPGNGPGIDQGLPSILMRMDFKNSRSQAFIFNSSRLERRFYFGWMRGADGRFSVDAGARQAAKMPG